MTISNITVNRMPATLIFKDGHMILDVDASANSLITNEAAALKKLKEFGVVKELNLTQPQPAFVVSASDTPTETSTGSPIPATQP